MSSVINDPLAEAWLESLIATQCYASLHFEVPNPDDPGASEVTGPTYARSMLAWEWALNDRRSIVNLQDLAWTNLDQVTIVAVGVWTEPTKGDLLLWAQLDEPIPVQDRGSWMIAAKEFYVHL